MQHHRFPTGPSRRQICAGVGLALFVPALSARAAESAASASSPASAMAPVQVRDFDWLDPTRQREVPVRLYLPADAATRPLPMVIFSHGIGGSRRGYSYLGRHWAAQGMASLHLQHVGSDRNLWMGNPLALLGRLHDAAQESEALARVQDLRFALDRMLDGAAGVAVDAQRIVAAGHSYGANTTLLAAGAHVERQGQRLDLREPRLRAAIVISAPPFYGERDQRGVLAGIRVPSLHVTATEDVIKIPGYFSDAGDRVRVFDAIGSTRKILAVFEGGSHSIFTDRGGTGGVELNPRVKAATQELSWAFLRSVFDGVHDPLEQWPNRHAAIVARFVGATG
jgi:dienelactone hydrolase